MYSGPDAIAYFVRETVRSTWFTTVPVVLARASGQPAFGQEFSVSVSRAGDYLINTFLRVHIPSVTLKTTNSQFGVNGSIRWTKNLAHNLIRECAISFNDLIAARFDAYFLDFWSAFTVAAGKRVGYNNMIGFTSDLIQPHNAGTAIPETVLNLPLPFWFSRDSGLALPTASLPYNEIRLQFNFRDWKDLLILSNNAYDGTPAKGAAYGQISAADLEGGEPTLGNCQIFATYAIVSNEERRRMGCTPRDCLVEQVQTAPIQNYTPATNSSPTYDIRFSHAIKVLFFAVRNVTNTSEHSNYTCASPVLQADPTDTTGKTYLVNFSPSGADDPIKHTSLIYENTPRLSNMGSDYFSLVNPWYTAPTIPMETGYHCYSYALDFYSLDPCGSTNFGKLTNVSIAPEASDPAITASNGTGGAGSGANWQQKFHFIVIAVNYNVIRISGGALGLTYRIDIWKSETVGCRTSCALTGMDKQCNMHYVAACA